jgi:hypothetical protein
MGEHQAPWFWLMRKPAKFWHGISPPFDPLDRSKMGTWRSDERSPLLNRVVQGSTRPALRWRLFCCRRQPEQHFPTTPKD